MSYIDMQSLKEGWSDDECELEVIKIYLQTEPPGEGPDRLLYWKGRL